MEELIAEPLVTCDIQRNYAGENGKKKKDGQRDELRSRKSGGRTKERKYETK